MKPFFIITMALCMHMAAYSQATATVVQNKLDISGKNQQEALKITKSELAQVEQFTSLLGKIKGYTIGFKVNDSTYFSKKSETEYLDAEVKKKLIALAPGTHFYLYSVNIETSNQSGLAEKRYVFVLAE